METTGAAEPEWRPQESAEPEWRPQESVEPEWRLQELAEPEWRPPERQSLSGDHKSRQSLSGDHRTRWCWQTAKQRLQYPGEDHKHNVVEVDCELDNINAESQTRRVGDCELIRNESVEPLYFEAGKKSVRSRTP